MAFIRLIDREHYVYRKSRFSSLAFKDYDATGVSVIDLDCAERANTSICRHVELHYRSYLDPTIFWDIPDDRIPGEYPTIEDATEGDDCHYNIKNMPKEVAERLSKAIPVGECLICEDGVARPLTLADLPPNPYPPTAPQV